MKKYISIIAILIISILSFSLRTNVYSANNLTEEQQAELEKQRNNYLSKIEVSGYDLSPEFNKYTYTYYVSIPSSVTSLDIDVTPENESAKTAISGNSSLTKNENTITITVTPQKGYKRNYTIIASKQTNNGLSLTNLEVEGVALDPEFSSDRYSYSFTVKQKGENKPFNITATPNDIAAEVEILGNDENLSDGENIITILLTSGNNRTTYQITATIAKSNEKEIITYVQDDDLFTKIKNQVVDFFSDENRTLSFLIAIGCVLLVIIIIIIIKMHRRKKINKNKEQIKNRAR